MHYSLGLRQIKIKFPFYSTIILKKQLQSKQIKDKQVIQIYQLGLVLILKKKLCS